MMPGKHRHGCCRGIFGLDSWDPLPRPGKLAEDINGNGDKPNRNTTRENSPPSQIAQVKTVDIRYKNSASSATVEEPVNRESLPKSSGPRLIAAYSYKANPDSPLGKELTMKQGTKLWLVSKVNDHWWEVVTAEGEKGHVPSNYVMVLEDKPTSLPWLATKKAAQEEEEPENKSKFALPKDKALYKPYKPTFDHSDKGLKSSAESNANQYYCKVCEKKLNGPIPYQMHLNSKAHKEEVELAKEYGREV